jgi:hypothetical protein
VPDEELCAEVRRLAALPRSRQCIIWRNARHAKQELMRRQTVGGASPPRFGLIDLPIEREALKA